MRLHERVEDRIKWLCGHVIRDNSSQILLKVTKGGRYDATCTNGWT